MTNTTLTPATEKQVAFINSLLNQRSVPASVVAQAEASILDKASASQLIDLLKGFPYRQRTTAPVATPTPATNFPVGLYTVYDGHGHVTFKVAAARFAPDKTQISVLTGSNNERSYTGFGFITTAGVRKWRSSEVSERVIAAAEFLVTGNITEARDNFLNLAEANAISSGNCLACLRTLTVPASVHRGLGPDCAARLGVR
jgi:hypothetical protein